MSMYQDFIDENMAGFAAKLDVSVVQSGWIGGGVGVACWWLESDRSQEAEQVRDENFAQMLAVFQANLPDMVIPDAKTYFYMGFHWLLAFEVPSDDVPIH